MEKHTEKTEDKNKKNERFEMRTSKRMLNLMDKLCQKKYLNTRSALIDLLVLQEADNQNIKLE